MKTDISFMGFPQRTQILSMVISFSKLSLVPSPTPYQKPSYHSSKKRVEGYVQGWASFFHFYEKSGS